MAPSLEAPGGDLLARCAHHREEQDWNELLARFRRALLVGIRRGVGRLPRPAPRPETDDLLQEVFCRLLAAGGHRLLACRSGDDRRIGSYLARLAERVAVDCVRQASAAKRGGLWWRDEPGRGLLRGSSDEAHAPGLDPEATLLAKERRRQFLRCARRAAGAQAGRDLHLLRLAVVEGLTSREISERLGGELLPSSVDSVLHRLRRRLAAEGLSLPWRR